MFCKKCGKQLPEGASFCTACGAPAATEKDKEEGAQPAPPLPAESIAAQNAPSPQGVPVRTSVLVNGALQKQLLASNLILGIVEIVLGAFLLLITLLYFLLSENYGPMGMLYLILGLTFIITGPLILYNRSRAVSQAEKAQTEHIYEFYEGYVLVTQVRFGENMGTMKYYYGDFVRRRETGRFILLYQTAYTVFPVGKAALAPEQLTLLRALLALPQK